MNIVAVAIIILLIIIIYYCIPGTDLTAVHTGDVHSWNVIKDFKNKREAAELLDRTNRTMIEFLRIMKKKYHIDEPDDIIAHEGAGHTRIVDAPGDTYNIISSLLDNYNPEVFYENDPRKNNGTSYTIDKGAAMYICLRQKDNPDKLVDPNVLLFTMLHEAAHCANYNGWGHDQHYWSIFKFILHEAALAGIYRPVDYSKHPVWFCGLRIEYSPLYDNNLPNIWEKKQSATL